MTHGPELLAAMWCGEPEVKVRDLFNKAYDAAPCIISFDDLESYGKKKNKKMKYDTISIFSR